MRWQIFAIDRNILSEGERSSANPLRILASPVVVLKRRAEQQRGLQQQALKGRNDSNYRVII